MVNHPIPPKRQRARKMLGIAWMAARVPRNVWCFSELRKVSLTFLGSRHGKVSDQGDAQFFIFRTLFWPPPVKVQTLCTAPTLDCQRNSACAMDSLSTMLCFDCLNPPQQIGAMVSGS